MGGGLLNIFLVLLFVLIGGYFAASEIALVSLREVQVRRLAEQHRRGRRWPGWWRTRAVPVRGADRRHLRRVLRGQLRRRDPGGRPWVSRLGHTPQAGERVDALGHRCTVLELEGRRVARVRITPLGRSAGAGGTPQGNVDTGPQPRAG